MKFKRLKIPEIVVCEPIFLVDNRGYFFGEFTEMINFEAFLYKINFVKKIRQNRNTGFKRTALSTSTPWSNQISSCVVNGRS